MWLSGVVVMSGLVQGVAKGLAARFSAARDLAVMGAWRASQPDWIGMATSRWSLATAMRRDAKGACLILGEAPKNPKTAFWGGLERPASLGRRLAWGGGVVNYRVDVCVRGVKSWMPACAGMTVVGEPGVRAERDNVLSWLALRLGGKWGMESGRAMGRGRGGGRGSRRGDMKSGSG
jgi:hypothetical protein